AAFTRMCNVASAPGSVTMEWRGGQGTFQLTGEACEWDATSTATWVDFFPIKGTGPGQVGYTVYPNMSGLTRTAQIQVGTAVMTVTQKPSGISNQRRFLQVLYYNFMNRLPSDQEIANWETHLNGGVPRYVIAESFLNSPEFAQGGKYVAGLYVGLLNRDAEYTGWLFIRGAMISAVVSPDGLVNNFITSEEFLLNNGSLSDEDYIRMLYRQALGRTGGAGEVTGWVQTMRTPPNNRVVVGRSFLRSPEFVAGAGARLTTFLLYATLLARDPSKAERALMIDRISHGTPVSTLIAELIDSAEFSALLQ
ncbi:MAG TPA: DUF4214 domain-containing protein, partial [Bryobacteraceae bacterium]|nr:DUF4214 domain-containing protein [Bryobacteraceae bacterium]